MAGAAALLALALAAGGCSAAGIANHESPAPAGPKRAVSQVLITLPEVSQPFWERIAHQLEVAYHLRANGS